MHGQRNTLLAGFLVIVAIIAVVAGVIILGGGIEFLGKRSYKVRFELAEGVSGLKQGAEVQVGGLKKGTVTGVDLSMSEGRVSAITVSISISRSIELREGAAPLLVMPLLGSQGIINFPFLGDGDPLTQGAVLDGEIAAPTFLTQAGWGDAQREHFQNILKRFSEIGDAGAPMTEDARVVVADVREKWPQWSERMDSITTKVDEMVERGPVISEKIEARLDQIEEIGDMVKGVIDENRENVKTVTDRFASIGEKGDDLMTRLQEEMADIAQEMLENGRDALARARDTVGEVDEFIDEQRPNLRRTLANLRLGSDQLRDTLVEVRRAPWRLVYRPDLRELNYELLYDSARQYAASVSDLRSATESLESLIAGGGDGRLTREASLEELLLNLRAAQERFGEAEAAFMEQLMRGVSEGE